MSSKGKWCVLVGGLILTGCGPDWDKLERAPSDASAAGSGGTITSGESALTRALGAQNGLGGAGAVHAARETGGSVH